MSHALTLSAAKFWREYPRETVALGVLGLAAAAALAGAAYSTPTLSGSAAGPSRTSPPNKATLNPTTG